MKAHDHSDEIGVASLGLVAAIARLVIVMKKR